MVAAVTLNDTDPSCKLLTSAARTTCLGTEAGGQMDRFDSWMTARMYAETTRRTYLVYARRLAAFTDPETCTIEDLTEFMQVLPGTAPSKLAARKALHAFFRSRGRVPNPADQLPRVPEPQRLPRPLTEAEHLRWIAAAHRLGGFHQLAGMLLATTGARQGEARIAQWDDFSLDRTSGTWRVRGKGSRRRGPKWRQQHLHPAMLELLRTTPRHGRYLFPDPEGGYWSDYLMRRHVLEISGEAGLGHVTGHRIRHSVATLALARTGDLLAVAELLGHSNPNTTKVYARLADDRLSEVVALLPV